MAPLPLPGLSDRLMLPPVRVAVSRQKLGTLRGLPRSHRRRCHRIPARTTCNDPRARLRPFLSRGRGLWLPGLRGPSPSLPALHGFTARSGLRLCLDPLQTPPRGDALGFGYSTQHGQTLRKDFHLLVAAASRRSPPRQRCCWAYTRKGRPESLPFRSWMELVAQRYVDRL